MKKNKTSLSVKIKKVTILIPLYNEAENIKSLIYELTEKTKNLNYPKEIIIINDGSNDNSESLIKKYTRKNPVFKLITLTKNSGQTAAMVAGIHQAKGDIIVPMDADLQNDPADIQKLVKCISQGYDVVSGWRKYRKDKIMTRILPSKIANKIISWASGVKLNDYGCTLKAYRKSILNNVQLYGEMHRFIPIYAAWNGGKITEMVVNHRSRKFGKSKYGLDRIYKVLLDLFVVKFLTRYSEKPIYIFGGIGLLFVSFGILTGIWILILKIIFHVSFIKTPLPLLSVFLFGIGIISLLMGLLAEISLRTWFESQGKKTYTIKK